MKKQRWRWTKLNEFSFCQECGRRLDTREPYHRMWGTCNSTCYLHLVGMSWRDFY